MPVLTPSIDFLIAKTRNEIREQKQWMEHCGSTEEGYVRNYGSALEEEHAGDGGEYIYAADRDHLRALQDKLAYLTGTEEDGDDVNEATFRRAEEFLARRLSRA